jgi:hypothetical protein
VSRNRPQIVTPVSHGSTNADPVESSARSKIMIMDWENGSVGNNPGIVARLPRGISSARVIVNPVSRRSPRRDVRPGLPSAA